MIMRLIRYIGFFMLMLLHHLLPAQSATIREEMVSLDTYAFDDPNPVPILADNPKIYPYFKFEGYRHTSEKKEWKVVTLENEYIRVFVLPEIGGKVWGAIEKGTGEEFLYKNEVVKFRNIAMRGPWTSGGIEFNFGIIGHTPATATPVDYLIRENEDGSVSCFVGNLDLPSRTLWRVEIRLEKDKAFFETRASWYNPTPLNQSYYNWMTAAAVAADDLEFFIPGDSYLEHNGDPHPWPVDESGRNLAFYRNNNFGPSKSYHIVGAYKDFFGGYYHNREFGFGHWSPYEQMPGQKLWLWALSRSGGIWEDLLTESDGQYIEFQAGRLFNQYFPGAVNPISQAPFEPYVMDEWREIWFPIRAIGGMKEANEYGIINVEYQDGEAIIGINALQALEGNLSVSVNGEQVSSQPVNLKPMGVLSTAIPALETDTVAIEVAGLLSYTTDKGKTLLNRPFQSDETMKASPGEMLYAEGWEAMKFRSFEEAREKFKTLLATDPFHILALVKLSELEYRSADYDKALEYALAALKVDTYDADANYAAGNAYMAKGDAVNALESLGWAARSIKYRSAAYTRMGEVYLANRDLPEARAYAGKALDYNASNSNARQLLLIVARLSGVSQEFASQKALLLDQDPMDHLVSTEDYLFRTPDVGSGDPLENIQNEFREESVLELAIRYSQLGLTGDAVKVLELASDTPKNKIWLAYLRKDSNEESSKALLNTALAAPPDFVFPYRIETIPVLEWAQGTEAGWKARYYLALNYLAVGREAEGRSLLNALGEEPDSDIFYRFRARIATDATFERRQGDYEKAVQLEKDDWKLWEEYIHFLLDQAQFESAYKLSSRAYTRYKGNYNIGLSHAKASLMVKRYQESIKILKNIRILPFEHASESKDIYDKALLLGALEKLEKKAYGEAVALLLQVREWPENLGVGKPYEVDTRMEDYLLAWSYGQSGDSKNQNSMLAEIIEFTRDTAEKPMTNHLFGLLALRLMDQGADAEQLIAGWENAGLAADPRIQLAIAFFRQDANLLSGLRPKEIVAPEIWDVMETSVNFGK